jgi:hypothetical protein
LSARSRSISSSRGSRDDLGSDTPQDHHIHDQRSRTRQNRRVGHRPPTGHLNVYVGDRPLGRCLSMKRCPTAEISVTLSTPPDLLAHPRSVSSRLDSDALNWPNERTL